MAARMSLHSCQGRGPILGRGHWLLGFCSSVIVNIFDMTEAQEMQETDYINGADVAALGASKSCSLAKTCCLCHRKSY